MEKINKKAQIGTTLTWFTAFIIIFFIMVLFVSVTFGFSLQKKIFDRGNKADINSGIGSSESTRILLNLINYPVLKENILNWIKSSDEGYVRAIVDDYIKKINKKCYYFSAIDSYGKTIEMGNKNLKNYATSIFVLFDENKINFKLYIEKC